MVDTIEAALDELVEDFELLGDWQDQLQHVIDMGAAMPDLPESERIAENKVRGCAAQVWLVMQRRPDGRLEFRADSDSAISKGNVAVLLKLFSGRRPDEIVAFDAAAGLRRLGLPGILTPQRANGLFSMLERIRHDAAAEAAKDAGR